MRRDDEPTDARRTADGTSNGVVHLVFRRRVILTVLP